MILCFLHSNDYFLYNVPCKYILTSRILHMVTHFVDLAAEAYQLYSMKMAIWGLKHVRVIYTVNKVVFNNIFMYSSVLFWYIDLHAYLIMFWIMYFSDGWWFLRTVTCSNYWWYQSKFVMFEGNVYTNFYGFIALKS